MYRKITHNIVEEHFDHPMAEQIKKTIDRKVGRPTEVIFTESNFRSTIDSYFNNYVNHLVGIMNAVTGTDDDLWDAFDPAFANVDELGTLMNNFYVTDMGQRVNITNRLLLVLILLSVQSTKTGTANWSAARLDNISNDWSDSLGRYNTYWLYDTTRTVVNNLVKAMKDKIAARKAKNTSAEQQAESQMRTLFSDLSKWIQDGTIAQFPDRIVSSTTSSSRNRPMLTNDIM